MVIKIKFTVEGFNQRKLIEFNLDIIDAAILRYFVDFRDSGNMISKIINNKQYYWLRYEGIIEQLPILELKKPDSVYRRLKKMANANVLESITVKQGGSYSFYRTGINYLSLVSDRNPSETDVNPRVSDRNPMKSDENPEHNINLLYSSNNNSSINNIFNHWNDCNIVVHKKITKNIEKAYKKVIKEFTVDEINTAITNYSKIIKDDRYFFKYKWSLDEFLNRGLTKFLDWKVCSTNFTKNTIGKAKDTFNDYEQREYDYVSLERKLLGWDKDNAENE